MTASAKMDSKVSESVFTELLILNVFCFVVVFIPSNISTKFPLDDAVHISSSDKSTKFDGTMLRVRFTNLVIASHICDIKTLTFYPFIYFRLDVFSTS